MSEPDLKADSSFSSLAVNMEACLNAILPQTDEFSYKGMELFQASHGGWPPKF
jgi:hypothetical protein